MTSFDLELAQILLRQIKSEMEKLSQWMTHGAVTDWAHYQKLRGQAEALATTFRLVEDATRDLMGERPNKQRQHE